MIGILDDRLGDGCVTGEERLADLCVPLPFRRRRCGVDERVGDAAHGGGDDDDAVALGHPAGGELRGLRDAFCGPDGGAAEFHDDEHGATKMEFTN